MFHIELSPNIFRTLDTLPTATLPTRKIQEKFKKNSKQDRIIPSPHIIETNLATLHFSRVIRIHTILFPLNSQFTSPRPTPSAITLPDGAQVPPHSPPKKVAGGSGPPRPHRGLTAISLPLNQDYHQRPGKMASPGRFVTEL